jgi:hypothetical protein
LTPAAGQGISNQPIFLGSSSRRREPAEEAVHIEFGIISQTREPAGTRKKRPKLKSGLLHKPPSKGREGGG